MASAGKVLMLVENLSVPFDRRVWQEATTLKSAGYEVSVICPHMVNRKSFEILEGVALYRPPMPYTANRAIGYELEYSWMLFFSFIYSLFYCCFLFTSFSFNYLYSFDGKSNHC